MIADSKEYESRQLTDNRLVALDAYHHNRKNILKHTNNLVKSRETAKDCSAVQSALGKGLVASTIDKTEAMQIANQLKTVKTFTHTASKDHSAMQLVNSKKRLRVAIK